MANNNQINSPLTSVPTALGLAIWDANKNFSAVGFITGYTTTVTAASTTTLAVGSNQQQFFTGTTTQTVVMPVTSTLVLGQSWTITNNSTGAITINSSGGNLILTLPAASETTVTCILITGTTAASWITTPAVSGSGTVSSGTINQLAYYSATGTAVAGLATANNGVLVTSAGGVPSISTTLPAGLTIPQPNIVGVTTNSNAAAGSLGEFVSSIIASGSPTAITSTTATDMTSISLTAGDWDVWGNIQYIMTLPAGSQFVTWLSSTSATIPDSSLFCNNIVSATNAWGAIAPSRRFSLSGTTTIYISGYAVVTSGTASMQGGIYARRVH